MGAIICILQMSKLSYKHSKPLPQDMHLTVMEPGVRLGV